MQGSCVDCTIGCRKVSRPVPVGLSLLLIMTESGELLHNTTVKGAKYCNLTDSCLVSTANLGFVIAFAPLTVIVVTMSGDRALERHDIWTLRCSRGQNVVHDASEQSRPDTSTIKRLDSGENDSGQTSCECHCLGTRSTTFFNNCEDVWCARRRSCCCSWYHTVPALYAALLQRVARAQTLNQAHARCGRPPVLHQVHCKHRQA